MCFLFAPHTSTFLICKKISSVQFSNFQWGNTVDHICRYKLDRKKRPGLTLPNCSKVNSTALVFSGIKQFNKDGGSHHTNVTYLCVLVEFWNENFQCANFISVCGCKKKHLLSRVLLANKF
jgi:hypothetical protein